MIRVNALRIIALVPNDLIIRNLAVEHHVTEPMTTDRLPAKTERRVSFVADRALVYPAIRLLLDFDA